MTVTIKTITAAVLAATAQAKAPSVEQFTSDSSGFDTHSYWFDTGKEVVVFDAQFTPALAEKLLAAIRAKTKNPIRYVVVTHPNPDKFNGAKVLQAAGAKLVASEHTARAIPGVHAYKKHFFVNVAKMFTEESYPHEPTVDITFSGALDLPLQGNARIELRELKHAGVSSTQTVAYLPAQRSLMVGDLVHHRAHAWLEGGIINGAPRPELGEWNLALNELLAFKGATVYGGRGQAAPVEVAVREEQRYLAEADRIVRAYVAGIKAPQAALAGPDAARHYKAITAQLAKAFPNYTLSYLVEYGVYGLANAIAASAPK